MSIQKIHGIYHLICDNCGEEHEQEFGYFYEAVDAKKDGWRSRKVNGHWEDWCPKCEEGE